MIEREKKNRLDESSRLLLVRIAHRNNENRHMHCNRAVCRRDNKKHDESEETDGEEEIENVRVKERSEASGPRPIMVRRAK